MDTKRFVSVICEYNPFHFGHRFQMETLKSEFDGVACIMSGDIVQRGSAAVANKYLRAEAALKNGADLVLELPIPWCCSSASDFARAGVHIADAIGSDALAFGAEDSPELLFDIHRLTKNSDFAQAVRNFVEEHKNASYPQAVTELVGSALGETASLAVKKPNNILALEYLSAMNGKALSPFIIKRQKGFFSSTEIRNAESGEKMLDLIPEQSRQVFEPEINKSFPRDDSKLNSFFIGTLRRMNESGLYPTDIYSAPDDLVKKILAASIKCSSVNAIVAECTDKNYTSARIRRAVNAIVFGITAKQIHQMPSYTCVLAANETGRSILRRAKQKAVIDIVTKPIRALDCTNETKKSFLFAKGIEDIISLSDPIPSPADTGKKPTIEKNND